MARNRRVLSFVALAASGCLFASGCSVVMSWVSGDGPPVVREEFPYVKEGVIFQDTGQDATMRFAITGLERTDDYTVLHYETTYPDEFGVCDGSAEIGTGATIGQQSRKKFGFSFRTKVNAPLHHIFQNFQQRFIA